MTTIHDPVAAVEEAYRRLAGGQEAAWISVVPEAVALARARELLDEGRRDRPLWGVPFAVKDNIDVAGMVTTAGCPAYASTAERTAPAEIHDAGAPAAGGRGHFDFGCGDLAHGFTPRSRRTAQPRGAGQTEGRIPPRRREISAGCGFACPALRCADRRYA